jgi:hypothetical protein
VCEVGDRHAKSGRQRREDVVVGRQAPGDGGFPEALRRILGELRDLRRIDEGLQRRQQPVVPGRAIIASQLIPA